MVRRLLLLPAATLTLGLSAPAAAAPPLTVAERLDAVSAALVEMHAIDRRAEIDALVTALLDDAASRATWQDGAAHAGWDNGFVIRDAGGVPRVKIDGQFQINLNGIVGRGDVPADSSRWGVENRRTKLKFSGALTERVAYAIGSSFDRRSDAMEISDAFIAWTATDDVAVTIGRQRAAFIREEGVSAKRLSFADRSLVAKQFGLDRAVGLEVAWRGAAWRAAASVQNVDDHLFGDESWHATARVEWKPLGAWRRARDTTSFRGDDALTMIGGGVRYLREAPAGMAPRDAIIATLDASLEWGGAHLMVTGTQRDGDGIADAWGAMIQGGVFLTERDEVVGRLSVGSVDGDADDLTVLTIGVNHYVDGHRVRLSGDVGYAIDDVSASWSSSGAGWPDAEAGSVLVRGQIQLLF